MPSSGLQTLPFTKPNLNGLFGQGPSVEYLFDYLRELKAETILYEGHYVDRHYLDDFSTYYARSFQAPEPSCGRAHFFSAEPVAVTDTVSKAYANDADLKRSEQGLQQSYLGFVVRRPLAVAQVGRTVLATYPLNGRRFYGAIRPYPVQIGGLRVEVQGLAYQQQDGGAAVCASTALWSALQRVAYTSGHRTPTPSAVTRAAGSPFPASHGLELSQMAQALSALGYVADLLVPQENRPLFRAQVGICLLSKLPVILLLGREEESEAGTHLVGHAVTATGYSEPTTSVEVPSPLKGEAPLRLRTAAIDTLYVHDDNLGSHCHYELFDAAETNEQGHAKQMLRRGRKDSPAPAWWTVDEWEVQCALIPKPEKLRLSVEALFHNLLWLRKTLEQIAFQGLKLDYSARFTTGVEYRRSVVGAPFLAPEMTGFQAALSLPRFIGVIGVHLGNERLCDVILDVSEVPRRALQPSVLALVCPGVPLRSPASLQLAALSRFFQCHLICGPAVP